MTFDTYPKKKWYLNSGKTQQELKDDTMRIQYGAGITETGNSFIRITYK